MSLLFKALDRLGFCPPWINWVPSMYWLATLAIKVNGVMGSSFILSRLIRQGYLLVTYLFILVADVFKHMLNNLKYEVESLILFKTRNKHLLMTSLYISKGTTWIRCEESLNTFYLTFGTKIN
jgi:hypothetical protein